MKVLIVGSGGREHAIAWKIAQSNEVDEIYCAPGNGGTAKELKCKNVDLKNNCEILQFAKDNNIDLTVIGPEEPLINGIADDFKNEKLRIFGPSQKGAMLEGSKIYAKSFMNKYGVKTAEYAAFNEIKSAVEYLKGCTFPIVIKADGIAAGKGVVICSNLIQAEETLNDFMIKDVFNGSGKNVIIEQFLEGVEASILCITDGKSIIPFLSAKDHKAIFDGDKGPNTGGMGAIAPNPYCTDNILQRFKEKIMLPTLHGIREEGLDYIGIVFFGIMITKDDVYLLEYNVRMGDPETQAVLSLMDSDLTELLQQAVNRKLDEFNIKWKEGSACCIVAASGGYPGKFSKGFEINEEETLVSKIFIAGAEICNNTLKTTGGRVLSVTANGETLKEAIEKAYVDIEKVKFKDMYYRRDIGRIPDIL